MARAKCANCGLDRRPMTYREGDEWFCGHRCLLEWWTKRSILKAEAEGRCTTCWVKHPRNQPCVPWVSR